MASLKRERRPGGGGVTNTCTKDDRDHHSTPCVVGHASRAIDPAGWLVERYGVRPLLAERVAELCGLGGRA